MMVHRTSEDAPKGRFKFILKSLLIFLLLVVLTTLQFLLFEMVDTLKKMFLTDIIVCPTFFCVAIFHSIIYIFAYSVRMMTCLNWLMGLFIVECLVISLGNTILFFNFVEWLVSIVLVLIVITLFFIIALFATHDFTFDFINLFVVTYILFIGAVYFLNRFLVDGSAVTFYLIFTIIGFVVCMFLLYHCQCIIGGHYAEVRETDYLLAALTLYVDFTLLLIVFLQFAPRLVNFFLTNDEKKQSGGKVKGHI